VTVGLRWPGQGGGRGAPSGFPEAGQPPDPITDRPGASGPSGDPDPDPDPDPELLAPTTPLRTGAAPTRRPRPSAAGRMSRFVTTRWPGVWTGVVPTSLSSGYRRTTSPSADTTPGAGAGLGAEGDVEPGTADVAASGLASTAPRPIRARSHVKVHRDPDSGEEATVTPLPSLHERRRGGAGAIPDGVGSADADVGSETDSGSVPALGGSGVVSRATGPFQTVVAAVYAALADPLVNAPAEVREKRATQVRRVGIAAAGTMLGCVLVYAIFPVQTYLDLRSATQRAEEQREALHRANDELERRQRELNEDETVEEIAREDYGWVLPGEESYGVLPAPESTTSSTTAPG
jgi:cell division protein FtsB